MSQVFSRIHLPAGSHAAKHSGHQRILQPRYEEVPLQFRRVGLKGTVNMDPATLRKNQNSLPWTTKTNPPIPCSMCHHSSCWPRQRRCTLSRLFANLAFKDKMCLLTLNANIYPVSAESAVSSLTIYRWNSGLQQPEPLSKLSQQPSGVTGSALLDPFP